MFVRSFVPFSSSTTMRSSFSHTRGGHARGGPRQGKDRGRGRRHSHIDVDAAARSTRTATPKPRLTHFLALPIGHHADLRTKMSNFATSLLDATPISGMDQSIIIPARRLHFTLGVMALGSDSSAGSPEMPTLQAAIALLQSLKPRIDKVLAKKPPLGHGFPLGADSHRKLRVDLNVMDVMKLEKNDMAHVVWVGPAEGNSKNPAHWETQRLRETCDLIHNSFKSAGFIVDHRPLKLHCTIINSTYRKPKSRNGQRVPFSYRELVDAPWFVSQTSSSQSAVAGSTADAGPSLYGSSAASSSKHVRDAQASSLDSRLRTLRDVDFGIWDIDQVQICEMGSWGVEGEYVSVSSIPLV